MPMNHSRLIPHCLAGAFLLATWGEAPSWAQTGQDDKPLKPVAPISERYDRTPVAGRVDMGLLLGAGDVIADPERLVVFLAGGPARDLCLELNTLDGAIWARARYDAGGRSAGFYRLLLNLQRPEKLREYKAQEVAMHLVEGTECGGVARKYFAVSWEGPRPSLDRLVFQVSSDAFETFIRVPQASGAVAKFNCRSLDTVKQLRTFNQLCLMEPAPSLDLSAAEVRRRNGGTPLTPIPFSVRWQ